MSLIWLLRGRYREREGRIRAALMRVLQDHNQIGDDGAGGLGEVLKVNSSLQKLYLVSLFFFVICLILVVAGAMQGEGGEGMSCTHACAAEQQPNQGRWW